MSINSPNFCLPACRGCLPLSDACGKSESLRADNCSDKVLNPLFSSESAQAVEARRSSHLRSNFDQTLTGKKSSIGKGDLVTYEKGEERGFLAERHS